MFHTKLAQKIWLTLTLTVCSVFLLIVILLELFFQQYVIDDALAVCDRNVRHAASAISSEYNSIRKYFVSYTASSDFYSVLAEIKSSTSEKYININTDLQSYLSQYTDISSLISAAIITTPDDRIFYPYKFRLAEDNMPYTCSYDFDEASPITIWQSTESPLANQGNVIAITFLLKTQSANRFVLLADSIADADVILYFFLNTNRVNSYLDLYYNSDADSLLYLARADGEPISVQESDNAYTRISSAQIKNAVWSAGFNESGYAVLDDDYILVQPVADTDLVLVNIVGKKVLTSNIRELDLYLLYIVIATLLLIPFLSFLISKYVTKPLKLLMATVKDMEYRSYRGLPAFVGDDEIVRLGHSIDSMYQTILKQFDMIKEEEQEHFKMEIRLLSEQINPHFLYNTLECINMEVYNGHNETASAMIADLGDYLRISLSYGDSLLQIRRELEHVKAYVNIMNFRFHHNIRLDLTIDSSLMDLLMLKSILQPLVENSIKHGFSIDSSNYFSISPCIEISIAGNAGYFSISVTDNGSGIDIARAEQIMRNEGTGAENDRHVGLHNIYQRLTSFYGTADISFSSIPFFENKVLIQIPYENFIRTQENAKTL